MHETHVHNTRVHDLPSSFEAEEAEDEAEQEREESHFLLRAREGADSSPHPMSPERGRSGSRRKQNSFSLQEERHGSKEKDVVSVLRRKRILSALRRRMKPWPCSAQE